MVEKSKSPDFLKLFNILFFIHHHKSQPSDLMFTYYQMFSDKVNLPPEVKEIELPLWNEVYNTMLILSLWKLLHSYR